MKTAEEWLVWMEPNGYLLKAYASATPEGWDNHTLIKAIQADTLRWAAEQCAPAGRTALLKILFVSEADRLEGKA